MAAQVISLDRIYFLQAWVAEQAQATKAEVGVEDVHHITRPVRYATQIGILGWSAGPKRC